MKEEHGRGAGGRGRLRVEALSLVSQGLHALPFPTPPSRHYPLASHSYCTEVPGHTSREERGGMIWENEQGLTPQGGGHPVAALEGTVSHEPQGPVGGSLVYLVTSEIVRRSVRADSLGVNAS